MSEMPPPPLLDGKMPRVWVTPKGRPYIVDHEDPRRSQAPVDHPTDEEIRDRADEEAQRADHDNQCQKDLED